MPIHCRVSYNLHTFFLTYTYIHTYSCSYFGVLLTCVQSAGGGLGHSPWQWHTEALLRGLQVCPLNNFATSVWHRCDLNLDLAKARRVGPPVFITLHAQRERGKIIGVGVYMQGCIQKFCQGGGALKYSPDMNIYIYICIYVCGPIVFLILV